MTTAIQATVSEQRIDSQAESETRAEVEQHSLPRTIVLHLLPGVLALGIYVLTAPLAVSMGFPADFAKALFGMPLAVILFQLAYLFYEGRRRNGALTLKGIVLFRERVALWKYLVFVPVLAGWALLVYLAIAEQTGTFITNTLFFWMPDSFLAEVDYAAYAQTTLLIIFVVQLVAFGAAGVVEEIYFRGYLLPRISRFGWAAPLLGTILFALYHLDQPWTMAAVLVCYLPIAYVTFWVRNFNIAAIVHGGLNALFQVVIMLPFILK